jgi:hypothetical protein
VLYASQYWKPFQRSSKCLQICSEAVIFLMKPSSIPILFLISVYVDNDWDSEAEEDVLGFLVSYLKVGHTYTGKVRTCTCIPGRFPGALSQSGS